MPSGEPVNHNRYHNPAVIRFCPPKHAASISARRRGGTHARLRCGSVCFIPTQSRSLCDWKHTPRKSPLNVEMDPDPVSCALMSGLLRGVRRWPSWVFAYVSGTNLSGVLGGTRLLTVLPELLN